MYIVCCCMRGFVNCDAAKEHPIHNRVVSGVHLPHTIHSHTSPPPSHTSSQMAHRERAGPGEPRRKMNEWVDLLCNERVVWSCRRRCRLNVKAKVCCRCAVVLLACFLVFVFLSGTYRCRRKLRKVPRVRCVACAARAAGFSATVRA